MCLFEPRIFQHISQSLHRLLYPDTQMTTDETKEVYAEGKFKHSIFTRVDQI